MQSAFLSSFSRCLNFRMLRETVEEVLGNEL
jgi:hypothetical protein